MNTIYKRPAKFLVAACLALFLMASIGSLASWAQPVTTAEGTALGGSGTAYFNGPEATFWNPANLMIQDRPRQFHISLGSGGGHFEPLLAETSIRQQGANFWDGYFPYAPGTVSISEAERATILDSHFPDQKLRAENQQQAELILASASWQRKDYAFSIAARARYASRITVGRGWYDDAFISENDQRLRDFSLTQHRSEFYELAFGYAQEFTFINGLIPQLNRLYIGIAPKIIIAGPTFNAQYQAQQVQEGNGMRHPLVSKFSLHSSGSFSDAITDYQASQNPRDAIRRNLSDHCQFEPTGYGLGFDFGLNYIISLEDDATTTLRETAAIPSKSLRIAFSLNDIGGIRYTNQPLALPAAEDSVQAGHPSTADEMFIGSGGQYLTYFHEQAFLPNPLHDTEEQSTDNYSELLPTTINTGLLLDLSSFKFTGDLSVGLSNAAFTNTNLAVKLGVEIRPIKQLPIRVGTRLAKQQPLQLAFGTGLETKNWDFNIGAQALFQSPHQPNTLAGGAFGGLQFHF